ncbi:MAG: DUF554 domain-containing protein [Coriobacteriia bacterium]|nr:DUF554 domain-containing protein [Coriobacteriia bacterium]MCL2870121.1 DUF554 domain-containing protein [Coriobacteriia bacterium]
MPGIGILVNISAIIVGSLIGLAVGRLIKERVRAGIIQVQGLAVIGIMGSISALTELSHYPGILGRFFLVVFCLCLIIGTLIGEALALETRLKAMGKALQKRVQRGQNRKLADYDQGSESLDASVHNVKTNSRKEDRKFVQGFITASLVYCVGAMAILGSIQDGLGNPDTLFVKALLDGTISIFFASTLGIGVLFSIIPLFILQGSIASITFVVGDVIPLIAITGIEAVGGILIAGIGLNLATGLKLRIGNMLPSVFVALAVVWIMAEVLPF